MSLWRSLIISQQLMVIHLNWYFFKYINKWFLYSFNTQYNAEWWSQLCRNVNTNATDCEYNIHANESLELAMALAFQEGQVTHLRLGFYFHLSLIIRYGAMGVIKVVDIIEILVMEDNILPETSHIFLIIIT